MNSSNNAIEEIPEGCYEPLADAAAFASFAFWADGVAKTALCVAGILGNACAMAVLTRASMRNSFNLLLVTLAAFDTGLLACEALRSLRRRWVQMCLYFCVMEIDTN